MIRLTQEQLDAIDEHVREGYPHEVCGIVMGNFEERAKRAVEVRRAGNLNKDRAHDRYELDPADLLKAEREGREKGMEIIGLYHSHPDHPDEPSEFDRARAWPVYSYLILSVKKGVDVTVRSWELNDATSQFEEEELIILPGRDN